MPVITVRHGERYDYIHPKEWFSSREGRSRPWDPPLTTEGKKGAFIMGKTVAQKLANLGLPPVTAVYSSPFIRTIQTAEAAIAGLGNPNLLIFPEDGLMEYLGMEWMRSWAIPGANGAWDGPRHLRGQYIDEESLHPDALLSPREWVRDSYFLHKKVSRLVLKGLPSVCSIRNEALRWGVTETGPSHQMRVVQCIKDLEKRHPCETILCVSHGGPLIAFHQYALRQPGKNVSVGFVQYFIYLRDRKTRRFAAIL